MSPRRQAARKEKPVPIIVRLPEELHAELVKIAAADVRSLNSTIIVACREFIDRIRRR